MRASLWRMKRSILGYGREGRYFLAVSTVGPQSVQVGGGWWGRRKFSPLLPNLWGRSHATSPSLCDPFLMPLASCSCQYTPMVSKGQQVLPQGEGSFLRRPGQRREGVGEEEEEEFSLLKGSSLGRAFTGCCGSAGSHLGPWSS